MPSEVGAYKTVMARYKTVNARYKTVRARYETVKARYKTVKASTYKTVKARFWPRLHHARPYVNLVGPGCFPLQS